jgi:hypothetical protein
MIILGLGARQIVDWLRSPRNRAFEPARRTTQHGSCPQWYQERPIAKRPLPRDPAAFLEALAVAAESAMPPGTAPAAVGIGVPGPLDPVSGVIE